MEFKKTTDTVRSMTSACQLHIYENNKDFKKGQIQTCHSMEMKNLDLTNKKSGFGGKNRDHGQIGYKKK